jgi:phytoene dehydrogenase-like protein
VRKGLVGVGVGAEAAVRGLAAFSRRWPLVANVSPSYDVSVAGLSKREKTMTDGHMDSYDVIFVGGGHSALVAAAYLAGAGRSVLVLDNNDRPGGFVRTDDIIPGFRGDTFSAAHTLFSAGPVYRDLGAKLEAVGLRYLDPVHPSGVSMEDGSTAVMPRTVEEFVAEADRLAPGDGATFRALIEELAPSVGEVFALFSEDLTSAAAQ